MKYLDLSKTLIAFIMVLCMALTTSVSAQDESGETTASSADEVAAVTVSSAEEAVELEMESDTDDVAEQRRSEIIQEAVDALSETKAALTALDENRVDDALDALAMVTGKLQIIVARDPSLALAPTDVSYATHELYSSKEYIEIAIEEAKEALEEGKIQVARGILKALASEFVVEVSHLPLATYPDAIAVIVPLIDEGKLEEAKSALQSVLNTQVIREYVIPIPVVRAGLYLDLAEELAENDDRRDEENETLVSHLSVVRNQLELSELLGYGDREIYTDLYAQLDEIDSKTSDGKSGVGFFDLIRESISDVGEEES